MREKKKIDNEINKNLCRMDVEAKQKTLENGGVYCTTWIFINLNDQGS